MPRVSVIVPLYNKAPYVARALDSIFRQDYGGEFEVVVVDDGSTDGSAEIVRACRHPKLRLVSQANAGPGAARNRGVALAAGELIAMLDADDEWYRHYLTDSVRILDAEPRVAGVSWNMRVIPGDWSTGDLWEKAGIGEGVFRLAPQMHPRVLVTLLATMYPPATVIRRRVFEELGGFYEKNRCRYSEDAHLWLKVLLRYPHYFHKEDGSVMHIAAAQLSANRSAVRPIEPFLTDPGDIWKECPPELREIVRTALATRALKTAAVYGYWGRPGAARSLVREFVRAADWRLPYFAPALVACTPVGGWIGGVVRGVSGLMRRRV